MFNSFCIVQEMNSICVCAPGKYNGILFHVYYIIGVFWNPNYDATNNCNNPHTSLSHLFDEKCETKKKVLDLIPSRRD